MEGKQIGGLILGKVSNTSSAKGRSSSNEKIASVFMSISLNKNRFYTSFARLFGLNN